MRQQSLIDLINPHPRQQAFIDAVARNKYTLYGGAGGGGKSYMLRWTLLALLIEWATKLGKAGRNVRVGLFSSDYPTLKDRQISRIKKEFPSWLGKICDTRTDGLGFFLRPEYGGGAILLRNLDDPEKYKSAEFAAIGIEELTENEFSVFYDLVIFRLRWPGIEQPKFIAGTNPTGIGHLWVKRLWITRDYPPELLEKGDDGLSEVDRGFAYVPAKASDNDHNPKSYINQLRALPPESRAALLDGSWDVFTGQLFSEFRREVHTCKPFKIPSWWDVWMSNDPGYTDDGVWHWFASDGDGNVYVIREMSFKKVAHSEQGRQVWAVQKRINALNGAEQEPAYCVTGMDAYKEDPNNDNKRLVDYYQQHMHMSFRRPVHGAGARAAQAATLHEYLRVYDHPESGKPTARLHIFTEGDIDGIHYGCPKLIETLPALVSDPNDPEAIQECSTDHWYQCCFVAGTMVKTENGDMPIERIQVGQCVWTRAGLKRVISCGSRNSQPIYNVELSNGSGFTATGDHPVWVADAGWVAVRDLIPNDEVFTWEDQKLSSSMALSSGDILTLNSAPIESISRPVELNEPQASEDFTRNCGNPQTEKYQTGLRFTTEMEIHLITSCQTLSLSQSASIDPSIQNRTPQPKRTWTPSDQNRTVGSEPKSIEPKNAQHGSASRIDHTSVKNADLCSKAGVMKLPLIVPKPVSPRIGASQALTTLQSGALNVVSSSEQIATVDQSAAHACAVRVLAIKGAGTAQVYNIEVEDCPEYFANGILVHNCAYGLQSRHPSGAQEPKKKYPPNSAYNILGLANVLGDEEDE